MKDKLIEILNETFAEQYEKRGLLTAPHTADHLLANGVMANEDELIADVYCPYCGTNLSGLYGEEPTSIIQCYICGKFLDNTKIITKEEAEKALAERSGE